MALNAPPHSFTIKTMNFQNAWGFQITILIYFWAIKPTIKYKRCNTAHDRQIIILKRKEPAAIEFKTKRPDGTEFKQNHH